MSWIEYALLMYIFLAHACVLELLFYHRIKMWDLKGLRVFLCTLLLARSP